jgi:hypothetical protein
MTRTKKGFLFTISIIFFTTTLLIFAQTYSNQNVKREVKILDSFNTTLPPFITDDVSFDLQRLLDVGFTINHGDGNISVLLNDSVPKPSNLQAKITDYDSFLRVDYFSNVKGTQDVNLQDINGGNITATLGTYFDFNHDYSVDVINFTSTQTLKLVDLNLDYSGDLVDYEWTLNAGTIPLNIRYVDDSNNFSISARISNTAKSTLKLVYSDANVLLDFGLTSQNNSFKIDSNISNQLDYDLLLKYNYDANYLPMETTAIIKYGEDTIDSNSLLRLN